MKWRVLIPYLVLSLFLCVGCGKDSQSTVPQTTPPPTSGGTGLGPITYPKGDPNMPDLTSAVTFQIPSANDYSGLETIKTKAITPPLVGDPLIKLILSGADATPSGTARLSVEDKDGITIRDFPSFPGTGAKTATSFDLIYADNKMVVRTQGTLSGDTLSATITYRVRQDSDPTMTITPYGSSVQPIKAPPCEQVTLTCQDQYGNNYAPGYCWQNPPSQSDQATFCRSYMTGDPSVKTLGTFTAAYSKWKQ